VAGDAETKIGLRPRQQAETCWRNGNISEGELIADNPGAWNERAFEMVK
jgi:hypothetical protein